MSCSLGLYGGGCFGYTAQEDETRVEAEVWSVSKKLVFNRDSVTTKGENLNCWLSSSQFLSHQIHSRKVVNYFTLQYSRPYSLIRLIVSTI